MMWRMYYAVLRFINPFVRGSFRIYSMLMQQQRVRVVLIDSSGRVLLVRHPIGDLRWALPGGGIEKGESVEQAAAREIHEELGFAINLDNYVRIGDSYKHTTKTPILYCRLSEAQVTSMRIRKLEIASVAFFSTDNLPPHTQPLVYEALQLLSAKEPIDKMV